MGYFYNKFNSDALNKAYELLENVKPLAYDCGRECGAICCKGDYDDGMILFPGEEEYFIKADGFEVKRNPQTDFSEVICKGKCNRADRPLACRIFPLFIYAVKKEDGTVLLGPAPDTRAYGVCPILKKSLPLNKEFERKIRSTARVLEQDCEIRDFLLKLSQYLTDFGAFSEERSR